MNKYYNFKKITLLKIDKFFIIIKNIYIYYISTNLYYIITNLNFVKNFLNISFL